MKINNRIAELRISAKMTQKAVAEQVGISETSVQRYEYGTRTPTLDIAILLADLFDVSLDYLVGRSDNPKRV